MYGMPERNVSQRPDKAVGGEH